MCICVYMYKYNPSKYLHRSIHTKTFVYSQKASEARSAQSQTVPKMSSCLEHTCPPHDCHSHQFITITRLSQSPSPPHNCHKHQSHVVSISASAPQTGGTEVFSWRLLGDLLIEFVGVVGLDPLRRGRRRLSWRYACCDLARTAKSCVTYPE